MCLLSIEQPLTRGSVESAASRFLEFGIGDTGDGHIIIRSGPMGSYVASRAMKGRWIDAFWGEGDKDKVIDVTGKDQDYLSA